MKKYNFEQNTKEWYQARLGIPTASDFSRIITPGGAASKSAEDYANHLIAETICGEPVETFEGSKWTQRGKDLEPDAILFYEQTKTSPSSASALSPMMRGQWVAARTD